MSEFVQPAVIGIGLVCFLMLYLNGQLDEQKHWILKLVLLFFVVSTMLLIPKAVVDGRLNCEAVVVNSTYVNSSFTHYDYEEFCFSRSETTGVSFLKASQTLYWLIIGYSVVFLAVYAIQKLAESGRFRKR